MTKMVKKVALFCGSSAGNQPVFEQSARYLCDALWNRGLGLVTGGGNVGIMAIMTDRMLALGGHVEGVMPRFLVDLEVAHQGMSKLHLVDTMMERKDKIIALSDASILFPGGLGSLDEFFECYTLAKLDLCPNPVGVLNIDGFYDPLLSMLDSMVENGFLSQRHRDIVFLSRDPGELLDLLPTYKQPRAQYKEDIVCQTT